MQASVRQLELLKGLVNGDFAAACRRLHVGGQSFTPQNLLEALADELHLRELHQRTAIGFAAALD